MRRGSQNLFEGLLGPFEHGTTSSMAGSQLLAQTLAPAGEATSMDERIVRTEEMCRCIGLLLVAALESKSGSGILREPDASKAPGVGETQAVGANLPAAPRRPPAPVQHDVKPAGSPQMTPSPLAAPLSTPAPNDDSESSDDEEDDKDVSRVVNDLAASRTANAESSSQPKVPDFTSSFPEPKKDSSDVSDDIPTFEQKVNM